MSEPGNYGNKYYMISVPQYVEPKGEFGIMADSIEITKSGCLKVMGSYRQVFPSGESGEHEETQLLLALQPNQWNHIYAASVFDGSAVATQGWCQGMGPQ